ncbi:hypothetical protein HPB52_012033 [Rhipicephalus sanguineus]|uniref:Uncharacterized protein n=1 Tax=Rhipicephalus sanguineus TaxID=34632 RepID=A0A9D4PZS6_RHISA|nr:hypothetical protein HPB52_012033 [Rhipicephalus sanguineus]
MNALRTLPKDVFGCPEHRIEEQVKFAAAHRLLGVALKRMDADAFRTSTECGPALPLLKAVVTEMQRLQPCPRGELHQWTRAERRLTVVRANGKTACLS